MGSRLVGLSRATQITEELETIATSLLEPHLTWQIEGRVGMVLVPDGRSSGRCDLMNDSEVCVRAPVAIHRGRLLTGLLSALIPLAAACAGSGGSAADDSPLPAEIHGLQLREEHAGDEAAAILERMHEQDVAPTQSYIGHYGTDAMGAMIYVSRFASAEEADSQQVAMASGIGRGSGGYGHHQRFRVTGTRVDMVFGFGRIHYFYTQGEHLMWLGTHPSLARAALAELMGVPLDSVPTVEEVTGIRRPVTS